MCTYFVSKLSHDSGPDGFGGDIFDAGVVLFLDEDHEHHPDQSDKFNPLVFGLRMQRRGHGCPPLVFTRRLVEHKGFFTQI